MNFWQNLKKKVGRRPIIALAPMSGVTDPAFRRLIAKHGKPDVLWTEFVSADAMVMAPKNKKDEKGISAYEKVYAVLKFDKSERPIIAQIFSANPKRVELSAKIIADMGFDGIDLNMGCPDRNIVRQGSGAGHIKNPELAREIILATKRGAPNLAVSVKTRIGFNQDQLETWLPNLLSVKPDMITIHARTKKQMSGVPADWGRVKRAVEIRDSLKSETLIFGNGDVRDVGEAIKRAKETGCDGVMIGRGIFGRPWLFANLDKKRNAKEPTLNKKIQVLIEHLKLFDKLMPNENYDLMKKHFKAYLCGFDGAKELRNLLMQTKFSDEAISRLKIWTKSHCGKLN